MRLGCAHLLVWAEAQIVLRPGPRLVGRLDLHGASARQMVLRLRFGRMLELADGRLPSVSGL